MSDKENNPVICLHTDKSGLIWFIDSANNLQKMDLLSCLSHIFSSEIFIVKTAHSVEVVHEVVIEFTVRIMPQLVVCVNDCFVIVKNF